MEPVLCLCNDSALKNLKKSTSNDEVREETSQTLRVLQQQTEQQKAAARSGLLVLVCRRFTV